MSSYIQDDGNPTQQRTTIPLSDAPTSTIAVAMLFGSITFTTVSIATRLWLTGLWTWKDGGGPVSSSQLKPLDLSSLPSIYNLLFHSTIFGFILLYSYICENYPPYPHDEKSHYDRDEFIFYFVLVVAIAGLKSWQCNEMIGDQRRMKRDNEVVSITPSFICVENKNIIDGEVQHKHEKKSSRQNEPMQNYSTTVVAPPPSADNEILNRYQTDEWKGWMQSTFLLSNYMHAAEIDNGLRVLTSCYVWMTGFGNSRFFYMTNDYSLPRVLQILWRLNFLVISLCLTHGNPYILYSACPLHTYNFLMVYFVMIVGKERNYTKWWIRFKLVVLALLILLVWDCDSGIFERMHLLFLGDQPLVGAPKGMMWEWYSISYLDHWSTLLGMVFAINAPIASLFFRKLEARVSGRQWLGKLSVSAVMLYASIMWFNGPMMMETTSYNRTNPYFCFIPMVTYIYIRNLTPNMRSHSMKLHYEIGRTTLETYLMQHHIWLTSNSTTVLVFLPKFPHLNMLLVSFIFIVVSRKLHRLTLAMSEVLLPDDREMCIRSLVGLAIATSTFYCTAFILRGLNAASFNVIGFTSMVCGGLLYQTVMDSVWFQYQRSVKDTKENDHDDLKSLADKSETSYFSAGDLNGRSVVTKLCPLLVGALFILLLGSAWNEIAIAGASSIGPLPSECEEFVNLGVWVPVDVCNESSLGMAYRERDVNSFGTCAPHSASYIWAWKDPARTRCRFGYRGEAKLKRMLNRSYVVFIGDSMTRNLYHATLRSMGIKEAGAYDATVPKHTDLSTILWDTTPINFKWAPLAIDQLNSLREINKLASGGGDRPDLVVLGGGAWDRLHVYATDEDRQSHAATLKDLSAEMRKSQTYGTAVVWLIPTTINSQALNTEEKRDHMREEDMEIMREVYSRNGVLSSASFVIDGRAFTSSRVSESFDGVHYPNQIYNAGAQILFQALDWLLPGDVEDPVVVPAVGSMSNLSLGMMMLALVTVGLVSFDGFLGFSYIASLFVKGVRPHDLYDDAYSLMDKERRQVMVERNHHRPRRIPSSSPRISYVDDNLDDEIAALLRPVG